MRHPHRTKSLLLACLIAVGAAGTAHAQTISWNPRTGDVWVDTWLGDMNTYGNRYRDPFIDEMVRYNSAPRDLVTELLVQRRWAPGDVYYACAIARIIGRPCDYVADYWQQNRGQGWGVVAQRLGIKPGSAEFHRLKQGFVPTYDRWSRPITLDAELQRAYPNRGKGHAGGKPAGARGNSGKAKPAASMGKPEAPGQGKGGGNGNGNGNGKGKSGQGGQGNAQGKGGGQSHGKH